MEVEHATIQYVFTTWKRTCTKGRIFAHVPVALALNPPQMSQRLPQMNQWWTSQVEVLVQGRDLVIIVWYIQSSTY